MVLQPVGYQATIRGVGQYLSQSSAIVGANQKVVASIGKNLTSIGGSLTKFVTLPLLAVGAVSVLAFSNFNKAMTESTAIMGELSGPTRDKMVQAARDVAKATTFSHKEAAESYFFLASAGLTAAQSIGALPFVSKFAQAGAFDMALATDLLTDAQSALGLAVDDTAQNLENITRVGDVFVKANTLANASVQQFSEAITEQAGTALAVNNKSLEEGVALLALWADAGLKGTQAGTNFASLLTLLPKIAVKNQQAFADYGIEIFDVNGKLKNFADIADEFTPILTKLTDEERAVAFQTLGINKRLVTSIGLFKNAGDQIREYEKGLEEAGGITEEVSEKQLQSMSAQFSLLKSKAEDVAITLGRALAPSVFMLAKGLDKLIAGLDVVVREFTTLPKPVQTAVIGFLIFIAALGPMLIILGLVLQALVGLVTIAPAVGLAFTIMTGPVGLLILALAAAVVAGVLIVKNWDAIVERAKHVGESYLELARAIGRFASSSARAMFEFGKVTLGILVAVPRKVFEFGKAIPRRMKEGLDAGAAIFFRGVANYVNQSISMLNPFNWVFGSSMVDVFEDIGEEATEALVGSLARGLAPFDAILDKNIVDPLRLVRDFVGDLQRELSRLLNLPSVESAAEGLALAQLALREFGLEPGAEEDALARAKRIEELREQIEKLTDARADERESLEEERTALEEERAAIFGTGAARTEERVAREQALQKEIDGIDKQIDAISDGTDAISKQITAIETQIEATEKQSTAREKELAAVRKQIAGLELLQDARRLERDILAARGLTADKTLATDLQIIAAANNMIAAIAATTAEFATSAGLIQTSYIPALFDVQQAMLDTQDSLGETGDSTLDLGDDWDDLIKKINEGLNENAFDMEKWKEDMREKLGIEVPSFFDKLAESANFALTKIGLVLLIAQGNFAAFQQLTGMSLADVGQKLIGFAEGTARVMFLVGKHIGGKVLEGIRFVFSGEGLTSIGAAVGNAIIGVINKIIEDINAKLEFKIPVRGLPDISIDPPDIKPIPLIGRALGGPLAAGQLAVVGERGPELFVPQTAGQVVPMGGMAPLLAAISGVPGGGESNSFRNYGTLTLAADRGPGADMMRTLIRSMT